MTTLTSLKKPEDLLKDKKLRGVILTPPVSEDKRIAEMLRDVGCDYIRIVSVKLDNDENMLVSNDIKDGEAVAQHLCKLGHKRVSFIIGKKGFRSSVERFHPRP